jgi:ABC-type dipeptide/oligopeptide/nickel transport system permease component
MLGPDATPSQIEATRKGLGLDRPVYEQLLGFYARILRGDLGQSYFLDRPVTRALWERAEPTLVLMLSALVIAIAIGVPSGTIAAAYRGSAWDRGLMLVSLLGVCIPGFWLSLNFIYFFAVRLGWLPAAGYVSVFTDPLGPLLVQGSFVFAYAILAEAILGFLGVGVPPYVPSWGNVIASGKNVIREAFWVSLFPGVALTLAGLSLNLLGDGLRDLLDPRLRVQ